MLAEYFSNEHINCKNSASVESIEYLCYMTFGKDLLRYRHIKFYYFIDLILKGFMAAT